MYIPDSKHIEYMREAMHAIDDKDNRRREREGAKSKVYSEILKKSLDVIIREGIDSIKNENGYSIPKLDEIIINVLESEKIDIDDLIANVNVVVDSFSGVSISDKDELVVDIRKTLMEAIFKEENKRLLARNGKKKEGEQLGE